LPLPSLFSVSSKPFSVYSVLSFPRTFPESFPLRTHPYQGRISHHESPPQRLSLYAVLLYQQRLAWGFDPNPLAILHTGFQAR
jgi:hypothetical protein